MKEPRKNLRKKRLRPWNLFRGPGSDSGTSTIEMVIYLPVFIALTFGVVEMGRFMITRGILYYTVQEATRWAIVNYDATSSQIHTVLSNKSFLIDPAKVTGVTITTPVDPVTQTKNFTVQVSYLYEFGLDVGIPPITMTVSSEMRSAND